MMDRIKEFLNEQSVYRIVDIKPEELVFDNKVRETCKENKCTRFGMNFMCPPDIGDLETHMKAVQMYDEGLLVYIHDDIEDPDDREQFYHSADRLNGIILDSEKAALEFGYADVKAFIAGHCRKCKTCGKELGLTACVQPETSRPSMESIGISVMQTCEGKGAPIEFTTGEVTWVALLLVKRG